MAIHWNADEQRGLAVCRTKSIMVAALRYELANHPKPDTDVHLEAAIYEMNTQAAANRRCFCICGGLDYVGVLQLGAVTG